MNGEKLDLKKPSAGDFGFEVHPERERGHVIIRHNNFDYDWFLREDGKTTILVNGDKKLLESAVREAMEEQVYAILRPELKKRQATS